ncbi:MAG: ribonuclease III [Desulfococcaceae bacterium]
MDFLQLEKKLFYKFRDKALLKEACLHSSYVNEQPGSDMRNNERLEFLGDAVLNLVVGHLLMQKYPDLPEGSLSRMRAGLVNENQLSAIARSLSLGMFLELGKGEIQTNGREKNSILADAFEAVIAAIYLDGGFYAAFKFVKSRFTDLISSTYVPMILNCDYKSKLQETVQTNHRVMPTYNVIGESGPDHDKTFVVEIRIDSMTVKGSGKSKKRAEQDAAKRALELLDVSSFRR